MKAKRMVFLTFTLIAAVAAGAYFFVHLLFGIKNASAPQDIGKIKYVTTEGNELFASSCAVVFNRPLKIIDAEIIDNTAHIKVFEFTIVHSPALGVVTMAQNGVVKIDHGNNTQSTISGVTSLGVKEGDLVYAGTAIGSAESEITFSVSVSELPLDMRWLVENFVASENDQNN